MYVKRYSGEACATEGHSGRKAFTYNINVYNIIIVMIYVQQQ